MPVASSSPRRPPVGAVAIGVLLTAALTFGCIGFYPGMALTEIEYYGPNGKVVAKVRQVTSWRQARVAMPGPLPEMRPLESHSEEYALALVDFYKNAMQLEAAPSADALDATDPALAAMRARMIWIDHEQMSGKGGLEGAIGALLGFLAGILPALL